MRPPVLALLLCAACAPARSDLQVSWRFVDGRGCGDAGVADVALRAGGAAEGPLHRCSAGQEGRSATLPQVAPGERVDAVALSPAGGALYRGLGEAPADAALLELVLYYTGR